MDVCLSLLFEKITAIGIWKYCKPTAVIDFIIIDYFQSNEGVPNGFQLVSLIEALNGPNAPQMQLNVQPSVARIQSSTVDLTSSNNASTNNNPGDHDEVPNAVKAAQSLNGGQVEKSASKNSPHASDKEVIGEFIEYLTEIN